MKKNLTYIDSVHRAGRIWNLSVMVLLMSFPIAFAFIFSVSPDWGALVQGLIATAPMYWVVGAIETVTFVPMLGAGGSYLSFVTGNISNLKLPCALNAMEQNQVSANSEEGEVISTIAIATSSIVTTIIIIIGVVLIIPLEPILSAPVLEPAFAQILPVGTAIQNARTTLLKDKVTRDGYHLHKTYGRYVAACTWYEKIFRKNVVGNTYKPEKMTAEEQLAAQKSAHAAVKMPNKVTIIKHQK